MRTIRVTSPVTVVVKSPDPRFGCAIATALRERPRVRVLRPDQEARADALLVLARELDEQALALMRVAWRPQREQGARIVLVAQYVGPGQLLRAVRHGLVGVLPRHSGLDQIVLALLRTREGRRHLPDSAFAEGLDLRHRTQALDGAEPG
ncbi:hypothetical protein ACGF5O_44595 [Streptomyces sp. NPDC048291]|uniref:hypothetical protein n=1 Tax=Streptomyces sp. NPDC048291 TaxID=3365530 RepID=UPI00371B2993